MIKCSNCVWPGLSVDRPEWEAKLCAGMCVSWLKCDWSKSELGGMWAGLYLHMSDRLN